MTTAFTFDVLDSFIRKQFGYSRKRVKIYSQQIIKKKKTVFCFFQIIYANIDTAILSTNSDVASLKTVFNPIYRKNTYFLDSIHCFYLHLGETNPLVESQFEQTAKLHFLDKRAEEPGVETVDKTDSIAIE